MKRILLLAAGLLLVLSLTACGSKMYIVETHDGETYTSEGMPEYNSASETYTFKDEKGAEYVIQKSDLKVIHEEMD